MKKSLKVRKLIEQNGVQIENFTLVIRLKKIIEELNFKISQQKEAIMQLKRDTKTTKINEMQIEIQHLNDQNKRLTLLIEQMKSNSVKDPFERFIKSASNDKFSVNKQQFSKNLLKKEKLRQRMKKNKRKIDSSFQSPLLLTGFHYASQMLGLSTSSHKKNYPQTQKEKQDQIRERVKEKKFEKKYYDLLQQTEKIKKQLINIKINQPPLTAKRRKSLISIGKENLLIEKNMETLEKMTQKKHDLENQNDLLKKKLQNSEKRQKELENFNSELKMTVNDLVNQIKDDTIFSHEEAGTLSKSAIFSQIKMIVSPNHKENFELNHLMATK